MIVRDNTYSDYFKLHTVALRAKEGDNASYLYLLKCFAKILRAYDDYYKGFYNGESKSVLLFTRYFDKSTNAPAIIKASRCDNEYIKRVKGYINFKRCISTLPHEDFRQELLLAFCTLVRRYRGDVPNFAQFVQSYYHFILLERIKLYIRNMAINNKVSEESTLNTYDNALSELSAFSTSITKIDYNISSAFITKGIDCYSDDIFNMDWIRGLHGEFFKHLTPLERNLILDSYLHKNTDTAIAIRIGVCRETINRIKNRIKAKL